MEEEIWKDIYFIDNMGIIYDYRGLYQVSNMGRIKNIKNDRILKKTLNNNGYETVCLGCNDDDEYKQKRFMVHRLVAYMFVPRGKRTQNVVDHINTIKTDNKAENLKWVTQKENMNNENTKENIKKARENIFGSVELEDLLNIYDVEQVAEIINITKEQNPSINSIYDILIIVKEKLNKSF